MSNLFPKRLATQYIWRGFRAMLRKVITLPLSEARERLAEIVDSGALACGRITITRDGRAAAVVISPDDLEASKRPSPDQPRRYGRVPREPRTVRGR